MKLQLTYNKQTIFSTIRRTSSSFLITCCIGISACTVGPDFQTPEITLPASYHGAHAMNADVTPEDWWHAFNDPILTRAIERALSQNLELAQVEARFEQAKAGAQLAWANLLPTVDGTGQAEYVNNSLRSLPGRILNTLGAPRNFYGYSAGISASWEIDLFGGLRREREATEAEQQASLASVGAMRILVAAEVADAYMVLRGLQARLVVAEDQAQTHSKLVGLVKMRFSEGIANDRELQRAVGLLESVRSAIPPLRAAIEGQLNRLDVLMGAAAGTYRSEFQQAAEVPLAPVPTGSLTPADLLSRRPDVIAAERRLIASNARIGAAIADYYPRFTVGASLGFAALGPAGLFASNTFQSQNNGGLKWRLFDFGKIDAEVAAAKGANAEALAAYRSTIFHASEDVETSLSRFSENGSETEIIERQMDALRTNRAKTDLAYREGISTLIDVLNSESDLLAASGRLAAAKSETARAAIAIFRALGGGWNA